ncbi:DUF2087 domain-containing protein [Microbacterium sp. BK668]|uniref:DUF2087 domain-containing protein n=1 Tax=Microbacterium sp. BK668 TaxID=2512118 RepID=UPI0010DDF921|nr:DUF2087 domain-containing protein [Microbacterium sp. BK668]TDN92989.1 hypothetical protein EV279_2531 [Microbacterium sp. BK668]
MSDRWRGIVAALLNPDLRAALAEVITDAALPPARRDRALARLTELGLVRDAEGRPVFDDAALRGILAESPPAKPTGPQRYLDASGRIDRYPVRDADRRELLIWVADQAFDDDDVLTEKEVNERLAPFTADVAVLRRYLVDHELIERTRSGSEYARVSDR